MVLRALTLGLLCNELPKQTRPCASAEKMRAPSRVPITISPTPEESGQNPAVP